jgi:hypothetical protein
MSRTNASDEKRGTRNQKLVLRIPVCPLSVRFREFALLGRKSRHVENPHKKRLKRFFFPETLYMMSSLDAVLALIFTESKEE